MCLRKDAMIVRPRILWRRGGGGVLWACLAVAVGVTLTVVLAACGGPTPSPVPTPTATPTPVPTVRVQCIPWYDAPDHIGETTCVEGRVFKVRIANAPRFAFFLFDPSFTSIDYCCGKFYAWVRSEDWCEYFTDCRITHELDGVCAHVFGTVEKEMGRIRIVVTDRSQIEIIDCATCQNPQACIDPWAVPTPVGDRGTVLLIIAPSGFNDDVYAKVRAAFGAARYTVVVASRSLDPATGDYGLLEVQPDLALADVDVADYDAVVFVGGRGATVYWDDPQAHRIARQAVEQGKVVAAVTTAPVILARAGVLEGRRATVYDPAVHCPALEAGGAICTGERVQRDGRIVTARLEQAAEQFAETVVEALEGP